MLEQSQLQLAKQIQEENENSPGQSIEEIALLAELSQGFPFPPQFWASDVLVSHCMTDADTEFTPDPDSSENDVF